MKEFKEKNLQEIINKQMEINGYAERYEDLKNIENWYQKFTTTEEKEKEFIEYLEKYLKQFVPKYRMGKEIGHLILNYGLKILGTTNN